MAAATNNDDNEDVKIEEKPIDDKQKLAAASLAKLFGDGVFSPSATTTATTDNNNNNFIGNVPAVTTNVINNATNDDTYKSAAAKEALSQFNELSPTQQFELMRDEIEKQYGDAIKAETEKQLAASKLLLAKHKEAVKKQKVIETVNARRIHAFVRGSTNFSTGAAAVEMAIDDEKIDKTFAETTVTAADSDDVNTYVKTQLEALIAASGVASGRAVGADRAFTSIGNPWSEAETKSKLDLTKNNFRNVDCSDLIDKTLLTQDSQDKVDSRDIILIEAGSYVGDICDHYWPVDSYDSLINKETNKPYKTMVNRGGYKLLSLVGLSSVGAMGFSGYNGKECNVGAIQAALLSVELMTVQDGKVVTYQIEPSLGNGNLFTEAAKAELEQKGVILIQDDSTFSNVVTSMGCYGVITHAYIAMTDAYYLEEVRFKTPFPRNNNQWEKEYNKIVNNPDVYLFEAWFNPYDLGLPWNRITPPSMVLTYFKKSDGPPNSPKDIEKYAGVERGSVSLAVMKTTGYALQALASAGALAGVAAGLDTGLNQTLFSGDFKNKSFVMSYVQALDFGTPNGMPTQTSGNSFKVENTVDVVNGYIDFLNKQAKDKNGNLMITSPFALRFAKKSFGSVSCAGEYDVSWIEQPILTVGNGSSVTQGGYDTALQNANRLLNNSRQYFQGNFESKIHWGLWFDEEDAMSSEYPWWQHISEKNKTSFFNDYKKFNKDGIFKNGFTQRSGMDEYAFPSS